jgi:inner membrane protein COX18
MIPQLANLPVFMLSTIVYQSACAPPSPLDSESVFTLTSLTATDPTGALPIMVGLLTLANVETSHWLAGGQHAQEVLQRSETLIKEDAKKGIVRIRPQSISKNILRAFSIVRIVIGMVMPGVSFSG